MLEHKVGDHVTDEKSRIAGIPYQAVPGKADNA